MVLYPAVAPSMALTTDLVVQSVPPEKAGAASGLATTANDLGISFGIAVIGSLGLAGYRAAMNRELPVNLNERDAARASGSIEEAFDIAAGMIEPQGGQLLHLAREAFTSGLNQVAMVAAAIALVAAIIAAIGLRHVSPTDRLH